MADGEPSRDPGIAEERTKSQEQSKRFRFKSKVSSSRTDHESSSSSRIHHRYHKSSHRRSKRRKLSPTAIHDASAYDDSVSSLPPETAFRESLFDALGDDEGAAFWEGVYGQPIHSYPNTYQVEETGELERMNDEEYAQFVRRKMWEKSWEGVEAAKEEKRRKREQEKRKVQEDDRSSQRSAETPKDDFVFELEVESSLRRGEQRKLRKHWKNLWEDYLRRWHELQSLLQDRKGSEGAGEQLFLRNKIAWPVETGKRKDMTTDEIERFILKGVQAGEESSADGDALAGVLKSERIKWHPDKIQQRFGFMEIDEETMQGVTGVFQVLDRMWNERRGKQ